MQIAHVIQSINPSQGGPAVVTPRLASAQAKLGHEVTIVTSDGPEAIASYRSVLEGIPGIEHIRFEYLPAPRSQFGYPIRKQTHSAIHRTISGLNFLHLHGVWDTLLLSVGRLATKERIQYALRPAGMLDPWSMGQKKWKKKLALAMGRRALINRAAFIHVLNRDEHDLIAQSLHPHCPMHVVPNGIFIDEVPEITPGYRFRAQHRPFLNNDPYVLFLSRLHYKKGLEHLARAFVHVAQKHERLKLVVAGPDDGDEKRFRHLIDDLGIASRVLLAGPIYGTAKYDALKESLCFCLPSYQEGFSLAILEALACATPVVISKQCHFPEVGHAEAGLVVDQDPEEIAKAILTLATNTDMHHKMKRSGRELIERDYTWPEIAQRTIQYYSKYIR
ncbi:MAG: glycosyltransferase [Planctomycetota bacterium]